MNKQELRTINILRYITPLREGGSLPAIIDADDEFTYVIKFRGAGQGPKALVAELIGGELARVLGLRIPEIVFASLDESFGKSEPDEEIQDLLKFSTGENLGLHYLSGAITFDPVADKVDEELASMIVWLDAFIMNVDRTARNTNMLMWNKELWLIDHGAALYFHHSWDNWESYIEKPFTSIKDHVLLAAASKLKAVDIHARKVLTPDVLHRIVALLPDDWLLTEPGVSPEEKRGVYYTFLTKRILQSSIFIDYANELRKG